MPNKELRKDLELIQATLHELAFFKLKTAKGIYITNRLIDMAGNMVNLTEITDSLFKEVKND